MTPYNLTMHNKMWDNVYEKWNIIYLYITTFHIVTFEKSLLKLLMIIMKIILIFNQELHYKLVMRSNDGGPG